MRSRSERPVVVLDYGAGNLRSVARAVEYAGFHARVTDAPAALDSAGIVVLPGVGAAADTMRNLARRGLIEPLRRYLQADRPFLGVCMGLQALMTVSEEGGEHLGLDVLPGRVLRLPDGQIVPHMGWNVVRQMRASDVLCGIPDGSHFYFVHTYYCAPDDRSVTLATTNYGITFPAIVQQGNLVATQFHPEKSGAYGLRLYRNVIAAALAAEPAA